MKDISQLINELIEYGKNNGLIDPSDVVYNGQPQRQPVTITDNGKQLKEGKDFTLNYSDDVTNVGTVTVTVTGTGNYTGTVTKTYNITPAEVTVTADDLEKESYTKALIGIGNFRVTAHLFHKLISNGKSQS